MSPAPFFVRFAFLREPSRPGAPKPTAERRKFSWGANPEVEHHKSEAIAGRFTGVQTSSTPEALGERPLRRLHGVRKRRTPQPDVKIVGNRNFIRNPISDITSREAALLELKPPRSTGGCVRPTSASPEAPESGKAPLPPSRRVCNEVSCGSSTSAERRCASLGEGGKASRNGSTPPK